MKFKDFNKKQQFIITLVMLIGIIILVNVFMITQTDAVMTFHITSDNNTLEIFKTINYTALS